MRIEDISIRDVLTANLQKTVEVEIKTKRGSVHSIAPVNKNGIYRIRSLGAEEMTKKFLEIKRHFVNQSFADIQELDSFLHSIDTSIDFREIGGNLAFSISSAFLKAFAKLEGVKIYEYLLKKKPELPVPLCRIDKIKDGTDFKEILLFPVQQKNFSKSIMRLTHAYSGLEFGNNLTNDTVLKTVARITTKESLEVGINFGTTDMWNDRKYVYATGESLTSQEQLLLVQDIATNYPVGYIEDPFHEDDFVLFATLTHRLPTRLVVGNDLYSNNLERFKRGVELKSASAINITPTQIGTISDVTNIMKEAKKNKISTILSCAIDDNLISNLAVGLGFAYIKLGMDSMSVNRMNELIRIESRI